jgi:hypothetical protein
LPLHTHHAGDLTDDVEVAQVVDGRGERGVGRRVGHEHQRGVVAVTLLADGEDRDVVLRERLGDGGEDTARSATSRLTW